MENKMDNQEKARALLNVTQLLIKTLEITDTKINSSLFSREAKNRERLLKKLAIKTMQKNIKELSKLGRYFSVPYLGNELDRIQSAINYYK